MTALLKCHFETGVTMGILLAPSILSADFLRLREEIESIEQAGADYIHLDVMDGHFVPNLTIGPMIVKAIRTITTLPLDVHLMIEHPESYVDAFADAGSDIITIHGETGYHHLRTIDAIKSKGKRAGFSLNPATPLSVAEEVIHAIDLLLIMAVNPGFGGQQYIPSMTGKIARARKMIGDSGRVIELEVDGGLKEENAAEVAAAGATVLVMGTEIFLSGNYKKKIDSIRRQLDSWNS
jgi:ribulose-phosphate 3-epimerase